jgi:glycosyltransferase involved in cell wall biosynthesis
MRANIKLLRVIPSMEASWGGPCQTIRDLTGPLRDLGAKQEVACCDSPEVLYSESDAFSIHQLGPGRYGYSYSPNLLPWLNRNLHKFDAVISHGLWQWNSVAAMLAVKRWRRADPAREAPLLIVMPHGGLDPWYQRDPSRRLKAWRNQLFWWLVQRHTINACDAVFYTCEEEMTLGRTAFLGYRAKREFNIQYGIGDVVSASPDQVRDFKTKWVKNVSNPYLLYLGRIHPKKGVRLLVQSFIEMAGKVSRDKCPSLLIGGPDSDPRYAKQVKRLVVESDMQDRIVFCGMLESGAKRAALAGCDAMVTASHQENFGVAIAEALASDRPVLITDKVNIWREIQHGNAGWVSSDCLQDFSNMLERWVALTPEEKQLFRPRACYEKHFSVSSCAKATVAAIEHLHTDRLMMQRCPVSHADV